MVESTSWDCVNWNGCGHCDACFWEVQRSNLQWENPELYESIFNLFKAYHQTKRLLEEADAKREEKNALWTRMIISAATPAQFGKD
jgi:hypothetical protein